MENKTLTDAEMRALPALLLQRIQAILGDHLLGFYQVGSLVTGDFDAASSDVDLIAVLTVEPDESEVQRLAAMHAELIRAQPQSRQPHRSDLHHGAASQRQRRGLHHRRDQPRRTLSRQSDSP